MCMIVITFRNIINHVLREVEAAKVAESSSAKANSLQQTSLTAPDTPTQAENVQAPSSSWLSGFSLWGWKKGVGPTATGSKESEGSSTTSSDETKGKR